MTEKSTGKDKLHGSNLHVEKNDIWQEISGRIWQGALIGEGIVGGGIAELKAGKAMTGEGLSILGGGAAGGAVLGALMGSKKEAAKIAVHCIGAIGTIAGTAYTVAEGFKYANDKKLATALDAVYKHQDLKTFSKQTKIAENVLGHEGSNVILGGLSGATGMFVGMKFAPGLTRKFAPATAEFLYGKNKLELRNGGKRSVYEGSFDRELNGFLNKIHQGDIHVVSTPEKTKPFIFNRDNKLVDIFVSDNLAERNKQIVVGCLADRIGERKAFEVVMKGAENANYHTAGQFGELNAAARQLRMIEGARRYAIEGSEAYYRGSSGNKYSEYLEKTFGKWSPSRRESADKLVKDIPIDKVEDGYAHRVASEALASLGVRANEFNRAAAHNKHIQMMDIDRQADAIRAVSYYLKGHPGEYGLPLAQRIPALNEMGRKLTPSQIEVLTNRVTEPEFEGGSFPHSLFDAPFMKSVDSLVSSGMISDATKAHKLLSKLVTQASKSESIETAELFVRCAKNSGIREEDLLHRETISTAAQMLKDLRNKRAANPSFPNLVSEMAVALKLLGSETRFNHAEVLSEMRGRGFDISKVTAESLKDFVKGFRPYLR